MRPINDMKSIGFIDNLSCESNERAGKWTTICHKSVYTNHGRNLLSDKRKGGRGACNVMYIMK